MIRESVRVVSALFVAPSSVYLALDGVDCWGADRNALQWPGGTPVVAHPPCRLWSRMRGLAGEHPGEKRMAPWAVDQVRRWGGVLEHPAGSSLWPVLGLPMRGMDQYGGWTYPVDQVWFGHRARKRTLLYVVGVPPASIPPVPMSLADPTHTATWGGAPAPRVGGQDVPRPGLSPAERSATPPAFARWLVALARATRPPHSPGQTKWK